MIENSNEKKKLTICNNDQYNLRYYYIYFTTRKYFENCSDYNIFDYFYF